MPRFDLRFSALVGVSALSIFVIAAFAGLAFGAVAQAQAQAQAPPPAPGPPPASDGPWAGDTVAPVLVGRWQGTGWVYGNEVTLDREWSLELADRFLRGEMGVRMANGASFRARVYWRRVGAATYEMTWMDELGQLRTFDALIDPAQRRVTAHYLEESGEGAGWRRLTYQITGDDSYVESMSVETVEGWKPVAEFRFTRAAD